MLVIRVCHKFHRQLTFLHERPQYFHGFVRAIISGAFLCCFVSLEFCCGVDTVFDVEEPELLRSVAGSNQRQARLVKEHPRKGV